MPINSSDLAAALRAAKGHVGPRGVVALVMEVNPPRVLACAEQRGRPDTRRVGRGLTEGAALIDLQRAIEAGRPHAVPEVRDVQL